MIRARSLVSFVVMLVGCTESEPTFEEVENIGGLCILGDGAPANTTYVEDATVDVHVVLEDCAPCRAEDLMTSCSIERDGSTLIVSASASWWMPAGEGVCPASCVKMQATCTSEPLPADTYTVEYAGEATSLTVPSTGEAAQLGTVQLFTHECGL